MNKSFFSVHTLLAAVVVIFCVFDAVADNHVACSNASLIGSYGFSHPRYHSKFRYPTNCIYILCSIWHSCL